MAKAKADGSPWCLPKSADGFGVVSNFIEKTQVEDCHDMILKMSVNGVEKQNASTNGMIF